MAYRRMFNAKNQFCASNPGIDSCSGDSGGPLMLKGENDKHYIVSCFFYTYL